MSPDTFHIEKSKQRTQKDWKVLGRVCPIPFHMKKIDYLFLMITNKKNQY
jgi:hypothetical protein